MFGKSLSSKSLEPKPRPLVPLKVRLNDTNDSRIENHSGSQSSKLLSLKNAVPPKGFEPLNTGSTSNSRSIKLKHLITSAIRDSSLSTSKTRDSENTHPKLKLETPTSQFTRPGSKTPIPSVKNSKSALKLRIASNPKARPPKALSPLESPDKSIWKKKEFFKEDENALHDFKLDDTQGSSGNLLKAYAKRFLTAQKIIKAFQSTIVMPSALIKPKQLPEEENNTQTTEDSLILERIQKNKEHLYNILQTIECAIASRKSKPDLEKYLEKINEIAQKTRNFEIQLAAMNTQGKVLYIYNDLYRAMGTFKAIKHFADFHRSFKTKLKAYKHLAECFHKVQNYRMAIFYNIKMLQTAWICNNKRYELLAYDKIGIEYYYLGNLEKANYFHEKMMSGAIEPADSKLRELGVSKIMNRMADANGMRKNVQVNKIEEELNGYAVPASEDEFELPSQRNQHHSVDFNSANDTGDTVAPGKKRRALFILNKMVNDQSGGSREKKIMRKRPAVSTGDVRRDSTNNASLTRSKNDILAGGPVNQQILLSHLSPNRLLNNFHPNDAQSIVSAYMTRGPGNEENYTALDAKNLDAVKKKLEKLKESTQIALKKINQMQQPNFSVKTIKKILK